MMCGNLALVDVSQPTCRLHNIENAESPGTSIIRSADKGQKLFHVTGCNESPTCMVVQDRAVKSEQISLQWVPRGNCTIREY